MLNTQNNLKTQPDHQPQPQPDHQPQAQPIFQNITPSHYKIKCIYTYTELEIFEYQYPVISDAPVFAKKRLNVYNKTKQEFDSSNAQRSKYNIRRVINCNPDLDKFITITFAENITDLKIANKHFSNFIKRMKRKYGDFKYISVPEFQKRGAVHYHLLWNLKYINKNTLEKIHGKGYVKPKRVYSGANLGLYLTKYLTKATKDERYYRKKKFFKSQNLIQPIVYYDEQVEQFIDILNKKILVYTKDWETPFLGTINYSVLRTR